MTINEDKAKELFNKFKEDNTLLKKQQESDIEFIKRGIILLSKELNKIQEQIRELKEN